MESDLKLFAEFYFCGERGEEKFVREIPPVKEDDRINDFVRSVFLEGNAYRCFVYRTMTVLVGEGDAAETVEVPGTRKYRKAAYFFGRGLFTLEQVKEECKSWPQIAKYLEKDMNSAGAKMAVKMKSGRFEVFREGDVLIRVPEE